MEPETYFFLAAIDYRLRQLDMRRAKPSEDEPFRFTCGGDSFFVNCPLCAFLDEDCPACPASANDFCHRWAILRDARRQGFEKRDGPTKRMRQMLKEKRIELLEG